MLRNVGHGHQRTICVLGHGFDHFLLFGIKGFPGLLVDFIYNDNQLLVGEQRLDTFKERALLFDGVTTLFRRIAKVQDTASQVRQGNNCLHFNSVTFLQRMIQNTRGINDLPAQVLIVTVPYEERFGSKCVWLDIDVTTGNLVHKARFSNIGQPAHQQSTGVGVQSRKARKMLSDLFQVSKRCLLAFQHSAHPTQGSTLQTLAPIGRVGILDHPNHISCDLIHQGASGVQLTQG
mmetsp:Transcript_62137/g.173586  ORF Transcript_62137/g.173586 Transcript_62137/m.173586 type:complete len:234 (-) Transcript_62137:293-994(-)